MGAFSGRIWHPAAYQGGRVDRRYFEGWYFKAVDAGAATTIAAVPGISFSEDGAERHAFVQLISSAGWAHYFTYPADAFVSRGTDPFEIAVGENRFSQSGMTLRLNDEGRDVSGELAFGRWSPWPVTLLSPGAMGPYRFVPRMETYHGVLSMDHEVTGRIRVCADILDFTGGRGYVEKDWGHSFPSSWVWAQSNSFERPGASVTVSVARIPWLGSSFTGHIVALLIDGHLHRFTTYTGAKLTRIETGGSNALITLRDAHRQLELTIRGCEPSELKAPSLGSMTAHDAESLGGEMDVTLRERRGGRVAVVFSGTGRQAAVEIMNDRGELHAG